jgi:hypothetical protein
MSVMNLKSHISVSLPAKRLGLAAVLLACLACGRKVNPEAAGYECDGGICFPPDSGINAVDRGADGDGGPSGGTLAIDQPTSPAYTNGKITIRVSLGEGATVREIELLKQGAHLATLIPPMLSFDWDTAAEGETTYTVTAQATIAGRVVTSAPILVTVDRTPPAVVASKTVPASSAIGVALTDPIHVEFSEPIAPGSVAKAVKVTQGSGEIVTTLALSQDGRAISATIAEPSSVMLSATAEASVSAMIAPTVTDLAGNPIADPPTWSWTVPMWLDYGDVQGGAPSLALDPTGNPLVSTTFEPEAIGSNVYNLVVARHIKGKSWDTSFGSPQTANTLILFGLTSIAADAMGQPILAWSEQPVGGGQPSAVHVARWSGVAWDKSYGLVDQIPGAQTDGFNPWLASGPPGLFVAWAERGTNNVPDVYVSRWAGSSWTLLSAIGVLGANSPVMLLGSDGQPVVSWMAAVGMSGVSKWTGVRWTTNNYPSSFYSSLALTVTQLPVVALIDGTQIRTRIVDGTTTDLTAPLSTAGEPANPRLAMGASDRPFVVWSEASATARVVRVARWTGIEWDRSFGVFDAQPGMTNAATPNIALDLRGTPVVVWQEPDPTRNRTYVRKLNR